MRRRQFITLVGGAAATWPIAARAQPSGAIRRVGVLMNRAATNAVFQSYLAAFDQGLRELGWSEGQNLHIDVRWNAEDAELTRMFAAQLIGLMPDVILAVSTANLAMIQQITNTVPIVFIFVSDPIAQGFVSSLAHPGGNLTGFSGYEFSIGGKWLGLLKEAAPGVTRVGVMFKPDTNLQSTFLMRAIEGAASSLGVRPIALPVRATADIEPALAGFASEPNGGLILTNDPFLSSYFKLIADLALRHRLPAIAFSPEFSKNDGLMDYGTSVNTVRQFRQAATYVDRILKGAKAGDLPIQQPDKYTLTINLRTAKALGLAFPVNLLAAADEVIE
jgi:putative ABC transport system substrate-binding protein